MKLSERLRPDVECAPWVIDEVKALENEIVELHTQYKMMCESHASLARSLFDANAAIQQLTGTEYNP